MPKCRNCMLNVLHKEDGKQFSWCLAKLDNFDIDEPRDCDLFIQATNADKIRSMTDEELAGFMINGCDNIDYSDKCYRPGCDCKECWLDWLKQEVSDGDTDT